MADWEPESTRPRGGAAAYMLILVLFVLAGMHCDRSMSDKNNVCKEIKP